MTDPHIILEIATADLETTRQAIAGGADRIELCANLGEGGTTPAYGTMRICRERFSVPIFPIIRPRAGDFLYTDDEFRTMQLEVELARSMGFEGVVIGLLLSDGQIDLHRTARLRELAYPMECTFHRAFDRCLDPNQALEDLINIGVNRILTSGQHLTAPEGVSCIAQLQQQANERIIIMPGSGVRPENIQALRAKTGCIEFHTSLRVWKESQMQFRHPNFSGAQESYLNPDINEAEVRKMKE
ncbi:MAG: copper homeostasis protein CutC [Bacteroidetes bacterium]|nr:copper homeostasis protein CutC [Bacteroidota bacterium]